MRGFIVLAMLTASLAHAGWSDYEETRELKLDASNMQQFSITAGAGSMDITGVEGARQIEVTATIGVPGASDKKAQELIAKRMTLTLEQDGDEGVLEAGFDDGFMGIGTDAYIALEIKVPEGLALRIDDGSGSLDVNDTKSDVVIDDGSGSIDVINVASVRIEDGSGSIDIEDSAGDVSIVDGSGSISVRHVGGSVTVDDGSGSIRVSDVENDLIIIEDGSGSLNFKDIRGAVDADT